MVEELEDWCFPPVLDTKTSMIDTVFKQEIARYQKINLDDTMPAMLRSTVKTIVSFEFLCLLLLLSSRR